MEARRGFSSSFKPEDPSSYWIIPMTQSSSYTQVPEVAVATTAVGGSHCAAVVGGSNNGVVGDHMSSSIALLGPEASSYGMIPMTIARPFNHLLEAPVVATAIGDRGVTATVGGSYIVAAATNGGPCSASAASIEVGASSKSGGIMIGASPPSNGMPTRNYFNFYKRPSAKFGNKYDHCVGLNFQTHFLKVAPGEDITKALVAFSRQGLPQTICVLSITGVISNVSLRQPSFGIGIIKYEGLFNIVSLSGSFIPCEKQGKKGVQGAMSITLTNAEGRLIVGGVSGVLVAASPVKVVVGSFELEKPIEKEDQTPKKSKSDCELLDVLPSKDLFPSAPVFNFGQVDDMLGLVPLDSNTFDPIYSPNVDYSALWQDD